jgi:hypothetical protein
VTVDPDLPCPHLTFHADVNVERVVPDGAPDGSVPVAYMAEVRVHCADCREPFRWNGLQAGLSFAQPRVTPDELELRAPLRPASSDPDFGMGLPGFAIRMFGDGMIRRVIEDGGTGA